MFRWCIHSGASMSTPTLGNLQGILAMLEEEDLWLLQLQAIYTPHLTSYVTSPFGPVVAREK